MLSHLYHHRFDAYCTISGIQLGIIIIIITILNNADKVIYTLYPDLHSQKMQFTNVPELKLYFHKFNNNVNYECNILFVQLLQTENHKMKKNNKFQKKNKQKIHNSNFPVYSITFTVLINAIENILKFCMHFCI